MVQFHINPRGDVGRCFSEPGNCPFGGEHFSDALSAWDATEKTNRALMIAPPLKKTSSPSAVDKKLIENILQELPVSDPNEIYPVEDNWGDYAELAEGELTSEANWILKNGQCLSFASELAAAFGTDKVAVIHRPEPSDNLAWDNEKGEPLLDEDGEEYFETYENIVHAYAVAPNGKYWDVDGEHSSEKLEILASENISEYDSPQAKNLYESFMSSQNREFSRSLIRPVLLAHLNQG